MLCEVTHCAGRVLANTRPHQRIVLSYEAWLCYYKDDISFNSQVGAEFLLSGSHING